MKAKKMVRRLLQLLCLATFFSCSRAFATNHPGRQLIARTPHRSAVADTTESSNSQTEKNTLSLFSPCKINLFLRIIRKREDGFHDLASLFQAIGFGDTLDLTAIDSDSDEFTCNMPGVPVDSSNLVLRALALMREKTGLRQYFRANLTKQVPAQAGLGGGSANAATAMWGANQLMGNPASLEQVRVVKVGVRQKPYGAFLLGVVFSPQILCLVGRMVR